MSRVKERMNILWFESAIYAIDFFLWKVDRHNMIVQTACYIDVVME